MGFLRLFFENFIKDLYITVNTNCSHNRLLSNSRFLLLDRLFFASSFGFRNTNENSNIMKKQNLKSLLLNKKSVSNLNGAQNIN